MDVPPGIRLQVTPGTDGDGWSLDLDMDYCFVLGASLFKGDKDEKKPYGRNKREAFQFHRIRNVME